MEIKHPRRALAVSLQSDKDHLARILLDLTGSKPVPAEDSLAGITHDFKLKTKYYTATVPIWLDLIDDAEEWASSFLCTEASEVLAVLGGLILVFALPTEADAEKTRQVIRHVGRVIHEGLGGWEWDGVKLAVGVGETAADEVDEWDELCAEAGLEFVQVGGGENRLEQFGEKSGLARVKEALEANEWDQANAEPPIGDDQDAHDKQSNLEKLPLPPTRPHLDPEDMEFGLGQADLESLKKAIWSGAEEDKDKEKHQAHGEEEDIGDEDVAKVEAMISRLQAAREAGETMSEAQRRKMAAKAVEEVMREL